MSESDISKIKSLSDSLLLQWFYETNNLFNNAVNQDNDELADKIYSISFAIENELLTREHIDLKLIYK